MTTRQTERAVFTKQSLALACRSSRADICLIMSGDALTRPPMVSAAGRLTRAEMLRLNDVMKGGNRRNAIIKGRLKTECERREKKEKPNSHIEMKKRGGQWKGK